jgi:hypothetical protein
MRITKVSARLIEFTVGVALAACMVIPGFAQQIGGEVRTFQPIKTDISERLEVMAARTPVAAAGIRVPFLGRIPVNSVEAGQPDSALQSAELPSQMSVVSGLPNFDGLGIGFPGFVLTGAPSDSNLSVGDTQVVEWVNTEFAIFDKAGNTVQGATPGNALWSGFGGGCQTNNDGDPIVLFDKMAHRWIFTQFSVSTLPNLQCFAISTTSDARGPYFRFAYSFGNTFFNDYPKLGVWPDGYFMTFNFFAGNTFVGADICAIDRAAALAGTMPKLLCIHLPPNAGAFLPSDLDGSTPPPAGSPNYFVGFVSPFLIVLKFHPNFPSPASSTFSGNLISVAPFTQACGGGTCIPQLGTSQQLDSLGDRPMYRFAYRNFGDHEALVVSHSIQSGSVASAVRWYEIRNPSGTPTLFQQGTFAPDTTSRWMPSIAMDKVGDIAVGYSASSSSIHPAIRINGRVPTDPLGMLEAETSIIAGGGSQTPTLSRWGDYSSMSIDPVDDCTFWYVNQYLKANGKFNWSTRIAAMKFSTCH